MQGVERVTSERRLKLAFLGPLGTYTHQAAYDRFGDSVDYLEKTTIKDVSQAVSPAVPLAVVPQENTIYGAVTETYDLLRTLDVGRRIAVAGEITLLVQHCLLVPRGLKLGQVTRVFSHEQALGQCSGFLSRHLPSASLVKTSSTAAAAQAILSSDHHSAAICSRVCATVFDGLDILYEGIQDKHVNYTRFYILSAGRDVIPPSSSPKNALIRLSTKPSSLGNTNSVSYISLLVSLGFHVARVDRRPSLEPMSFHDVYFVELQDEGTSPGEHVQIQWEEKIHAALSRIDAQGGETCILGIW